MGFIDKLVGIKEISAVILGTFIICFFGYLIGRIKIKGVSLGSAGVFLVALLFGYLFTIPALKNIPILNNFYIADNSSVMYSDYKFIETIGLVLFVTSVGYLAGPNFFKNLKKNAKSYVPLAVIIVLSGSIFAVIFALIPGIGSDFSTGILSGALTSTPAFSASKQVAENEGLVALGHAIAYPYGVIGVVLFVQIVPKVLKTNMDTEREILKLEISKLNKNSKSNEIKKERKIVSIDALGIGAFALAIVFGILLGSIKIPLTKAGFDGACFSLGNTGGPLIMALVLGHFGHIGKLNLKISENTLKVFRELGLILFLIGAGAEGGVELVSQVNASSLGGMLILYGFIAGLVMTTVPLFTGYFFAKKVFKLSLLNSLGALTGGRTSTPALGTLIEVSKTDDVAAAYASTYPIALVFIVIVSNLIGTFIA